MSLTRTLKVGVAVASLLILSCEQGTVTSSIPSPNGELEARVIRFDKGGATVSNTYRVQLNSRAHPFDRSKEMGPPAWVSYGVAVKYLFWRDDKTLEVVVSEDRRENFDTIRVVSIDGVTVVTTVLNGTSKQEVFDAVPIEVPTESAAAGQ